MKMIDIVTVSFRNLFRQKSRTILTIASMMVGAFLISIMLSVGNGLKQFMISQVTLFSNTRTISVQKAYDFEKSFGFSLTGGIQEYSDDSEESQDAAATLPEEEAGTDEAQSSGGYSFLESAMLGTDDLEAIRGVDHVEQAAFEAYASPDYMRLEDGDDRKLVVSLYGLPSSYRDNLSYSMIDEEILEKDNALVVSDAYAEKWEMDREDLLGKKVYIRMTQTGQMPIVGMPSSLTSASGDREAVTQEFEFVVAGFFEKSLLSQIGFVTPEMCNVLNAFVANKEVEEYSREEKAFEIIVVVDSEENVVQVDKDIQGTGDYISMTYEETIGQVGVVFNIISVVLSGFGVVAMVVASLGIANTLLMAIYERTREIGVMKAVGAPRSSIGLLFTAEAAWLGILGGLSGLGASWGLGSLINHVLHKGISIGSVTLMKDYLADYPTFDISTFTPFIIISVLSVTTIVALVAGLYPAWRASRLDPIEALRHD